MSKKFGRVLLKLSGEAFAGSGGLGVDPDVVSSIAKQIADVVQDGAQVAVVIGGGNYFRGAQLSERGMDRARADYMGMLGTVMNCLALQDFLEKQKVRAKLMGVLCQSSSNLLNSLDRILHLKRAFQVAVRWLAALADTCFSSLARQWNIFEFIFPSLKLYDDIYFFIISSVLPIEDISPSLSNMLFSHKSETAPIL